MTDQNTNPDYYKQEIDRLTAELAELRERLAEIEATSPHQYNWEAHRFIKPPEADND